MELWTMGEWKGRPQWRCTLCPWDTLEGEAAMREHIAQRHTRTADTGLVDGKGHSITKVEVVGRWPDRRTQR